MYQAAVRGGAIVECGPEPSSARALADLNGDGIKDCVVVNLNSGDVSVFLGNGDGTFQPAVNYPTGHMPGSVVVG